MNSTLPVMEHTAYCLVNCLADGIAQYTPIATDSTEYLQAGNLNYEIGLTCQENTLLLYINGKLFRKLDVTRYGLTEGKIGINCFILRGNTHDRNL